MILEGAKSVFQQPRTMCFVDTLDVCRKLRKEETQDLRDWYHKRVSIHHVIAKEQPFEPLAEAALEGVFVDIENMALGPNFWGKHKDEVFVAIVVGIIVVIIGWLLG